MVNSASPWQHTVIPLDTAISRRADASLNAPFVRLWQAFLSGRVFLALALILLQALNLQLQSISSPLVWLICIVYLILTTVLRLLAGKHLPAPRAALQWLPVIGVDIAVIFSAADFPGGLAQLLRPAGDSHPDFCSPGRPDARVWDHGLYYAADADPHFLALPRRAQRCRSGLLSDRIFFGGLFLRSLSHA